MPEPEIREIGNLPMTSSRVVTVYEIDAPDGNPCRVVVVKGREHTACFHCRRGAEDFIGTPAQMEAFSGWIPPTKGINGRYDADKLKQYGLIPSIASSYVESLIRLNEFAGTVFSANPRLDLYRRAQRVGAMDQTFIQTLRRIEQKVKSNQENEGTYNASGRDPWWKALSSISTQN